MNRKIIVAAVLVVLLAVSVCGVYLLKEDVRSELVMEPVYVNGSNYGITPFDQYGQDYDTHHVIGQEFLKILGEE